MELNWSWSIATPYELNVKYIEIFGERREKGNEEAAINNRGDFMVISCIFSNFGGRVQKDAAIKILGLWL